MKTQVSPPSKFKCFAIGEGTLLIPCCENLLNAGHEVLGVIAANPDITRWAAQRQLPVVDPGSDLPSILAQTPFDYLFSITNWRILQKELLTLPRRGSINFHDGPLPRYAGVHATCWAVLNREPRHGVTWHWVDGQVDAGRILQQRFVELAPKETAYSLNIKCFEAGAQSFAELLKDLGNGALQGCEQDLAKRTYFGMFQRPPGGCILRWNQTAEELAALARALDFGPHENPLGLAKIVVGEQFFLCPEVEALSKSSGLPPGTVVKVDESSLQVATADKDILLRRLLTLLGRPLPLLARSLELKAGIRLPLLNQEMVDRLTSLYSKAAKSEKYWCKKLQELTPLNLPFINAVLGADRVAQVSVGTWPVPEAFTRFVLAQQPSLDLQKSLLAAFGLYLARLCQEDSVNLALKLPDAAGEFGGCEHLFASRLPMSIRLDPRETFLQHLPRVEAELEKVRAHKSFCLDLPLRYPKLQPIAEQLFSGFLPVAVDYVNTETEPAQEPGPVLRLVIPSGAQQGRWNFDSAVLSKANFRLILDQFTQFLLSIAAHPDQPVASLQIIENAQMKQLEAWNQTAARVSAECLPAIIEAEVARHPNAVALICDEHQLTYAELNARANQVANRLRTLGVRPDTVVGLAVERSIDMVLGVLGILKAGGAYLPLDPTYPKERITFMLEDARVPILVTQQKLLANFPAQARTLCLDSDWESIAQENTANFHSGVAPQNLAYLIYTSGSTGKPKGVMIEQRNVVNFLMGMDAYLSSGPGSAWLAVTSLSFDISVLEIVWTLARGFKVVIFTGEGTKQVGNGTSGNSALTIPALIKKHNITHLQCTPSRARMLVMDENAQPGLGLLKQLLIGGEAFPASLASELVRFCKGEILNMYGPTETTIWSTVYPLNNDLRTIPIGRPIANTQIYIVDRHLQPVPIGVPGELLIGGAGVVRGYLNRPELTAERFIPNPFLKDPPARLYRTGDQARFLPDGNIEFLARLDHQVKLRGHRIELGEIEALLNQQPAVAQSVVLVREDVPGEKRLVGYVVARPGQEVDPDQLRHSARKKLPDYMAPAAIILLRAFPQTPNGKIDRKKLPAPAETQVVSDRTTSSPPANDIEAALAEFWSEKLGVRQVGRLDNFFELGGDSLLAFQTIFSIRQACNIKLPLETLFHAPTVAALAEHLQKRFLALAQEKQPTPAPATVPEAAAASNQGSPHEPALAKIWARTLGVSEVRPTDNFFDMGGNSLLAVNMFMEIEKEFGKKLPLSTLFKAPTLGQLAQLIYQQDASSGWASLVPIQPKGTKRPFFCVHAAGGNVLIYRDLARFLGEDYPFYGLQCVGLDGKQEYLTSIPQMAARYLKEIRSLQPHGPYQIGGFCMGGTIAYEMAQQLLEAGEKISYLAFFDTYNYSQIHMPHGFRENLMFRWQKIRFHAANLGRLKWKARLAYFSEKFRMAWEREQTRLAHKLSNLSRRLNILNPSGNVEIFLEDFNEKIAYAYQPKPYPGKLILFRPQQNYGVYSDPQMGWGNVVSGGLEVTALPVNPGGMFVKPYVQIVADSLRKSLDEHQL